MANIAELIDNGGQITIGALRPVECAAVANDEDSCLAMLQRRPGECKRLGNACCQRALNQVGVIDVPQRCGNNSSIRLAGCVGSLASTSLR